MNIVKVKNVFINLLLNINCSGIAPFINQLRELHNLYDDIQKKIQKRLLILKIKSSEQTEFLQKISDILHINEKLHIKITELTQN